MSMIQTLHNDISGQSVYRYMLIYTYRTRLVELPTDPKVEFIAERF